MKELAPTRSELKSIAEDLDDLAGKVENVIGYRKEIDYALRRIAAVGLPGILVLPGIATRFPGAGMTYLRHATLPVAASTAVMASRAAPAVPSTILVFASHWGGGELPILLSAPIVQALKSFPIPPPSLPIIVPG